MNKQTSQELREQRAKLIANARVIIDGADERELTAEEQAQVDAMFAEADAVAEEAANAERKERLERAESELRASAGRKVPVAGRLTQEHAYRDYDRKQALRAWCLYGTDKADGSIDTRSKAEAFGINLGARTLNVRALSKGTSTAGGHTVPVNLATEIEKKLKWYSPVRNLAKVFQTESGADLDYPRVDDTSNVASIVGEAGSIATNVDPAFDKVTFKAWKYASPIVKVSLELLSDSSIDIEALLADLFAERMGRGQEAHFVTGNGTTQPQGLVTGAAVGATLGSGNTLTFDKVIDLIHSVDVAYRLNGAFLTHDTTLAALKKLKDDDGRYLWEPSVQAGEPDTIFGYPVHVTNSFAEYAGNEGDNKPLILFGDMGRYAIRDIAGSTQVARLDELYAATGEIGFVMLQRTDARYIGHSGCVKSLNSYDAA